jgi:hypothetical protein
MTACEVLAQLHAAQIELRIQGDMLLCRPAAAVSAQLRRAVTDHKSQLLRLLSAKATDSIICPVCGQLDYMPLGDGWRSCWSCSHRWGPAGSAEPDSTSVLLGRVAADGEGQKSVTLRSTDRRRTHELYAHDGQRMSWWYRPKDSEPLCGLCHPARVAEDEVHAPDGREWLPAPGDP